MAFRFNEEHKAFISENIKNPEKDLVDMFNKRFNADISVYQLENFKHRNKLKSGLVGGQFKKGNIPKNKGLKWCEYMSLEGQKNSLKTCFKKGNTPKNHRDVGSERISVDGYVEVKVAEPNKWKLKHRVLYEEKFGPIPKTHILIFADGNKTNLELDNLILISRSEALIINRNNLYLKDKELTKTAAIISKLIDTTNKRRRKGE